MTSLFRLVVGLFLEERKMGLFELFLIAVGLSMDAFAVSVCKGLSLCRVKGKHMLIAGAWFGGFQALMPVIGYFFGSFFTEFITSWSHWIAFALLAVIGGNMIKESREKDCACDLDASMNVKTMLLLAIATSIDAMAVGVSFAFMQVNIFWAVLFIGVTTFSLSAVGVKVGSIFGTRYKSKAELAGGLVLIAIGLKILLEGLGIIA